MIHSMNGFIVGASFNQTKGLEMLAAILAVCIVSGWIISRPIVRAFNL